MSNDSEFPIFPVVQKTEPQDVFPVPEGKGRNSGLKPGPWMPGALKPARDGRYLRYFEDIDDCAYSEFCEGTWTRDGFFASDVQDAPWRGAIESRRQKKAA